MANPEIEQIIEYTKRFIDAATPIAKQAYEVGLLTLRIDAASTIVFALLIVVGAALLLKKLRGDYVTAKSTAALPENRENVWKRDASDHLPMDGIFILSAAHSRSPLASRQSRNCRAYGCG